MRLFKCVTCSIIFFKGVRNMDKRDVEYQIADLKADYVRLQQDLEKLEYVKGNLHPLEKQLAEIEQALKKLYQQLDRF